MSDAAAPIRTLDIRPTHDEAVKPSELIQVTGHQALSLYARRAITILWHHAHLQGIAPGKRYSIELGALRSDQHRGIAVVADAVEELMKTLLVVRLANGKTRRVQFLGGNDMDDPDRPAGTLQYAFDPLLIEVLEDSSVWGRVTLPVLMSFSSKYAISLYEHVCQWQGLSFKTTEKVDLDRAREICGVEDGKYGPYGSLNKHVLKPAVAEVNALAPFNVAIIPIKEGRRVSHLQISWWRKSEEELREAWAEGDRSRVGRRARIAGRIDVVTPMPSETTASRQARIARKRRTDPVSTNS